RRWFAEARKGAPAVPRSSAWPPRMRTYTCLVPAGGDVVTSGFVELRRERVRARLVASETKATRSHAPSTFTSYVEPFACRPLVLTETRMVRPVRRSRTNASGFPLVSPGTRFEAAEMKATQWDMWIW